MKKLFMMVAALAAMSMPLTACETIRNVDQAVALANQNVGEFTILDEKSWYYAEALYNVPATAYLSANSRGLMPAPLKATLKAGLQKLNGLRLAVYQAYQTGNAVEFRAKIIEMKQLSDQVRVLIPQ